MKYIFFLSLPLYALDQLTKSFVLWFIKPDEPRIVIAGFFDLVNITNTGAAFGSFKNNNTFFIAISCLALLFVVPLLVRRRTADVWSDISLALLLAGVLGNLTDRLFYGHVIDLEIVEPAAAAATLPAFAVGNPPETGCPAIIKEMRRSQTAATVNGADETVRQKYFPDGKDGV